MIIKPKSRGFICTTAHPTGCEESVRRQIQYVEGKGAMKGPKKVLVLGSSTGYGLSSRISAAFGCGADTLGVMFEKEPSERRTATAGYYNTKAFEKFAKEKGLYAKTVNGDAFSQEIKDEVIKMIKEDMGQVDMVVYSLAAPRRTVADGTTYSSVLKTIGDEFVNKNIDLSKREVTQAAIPPATEQEIADTVKVMGGEDWSDWLKALVAADAIADGAITFAYSYIGSELTFPIYRDGSIGQAKKDLYKTADDITATYKDKGIRGFVSINKALVTQASAAIPVVPLYVTILYKIMKKQGLHEGCIEQIDRLFRDKLPAGPEVDEEGLIRIDDYELRPEVQKEVMEVWDKISTENIEEYADIDGYWEDFFHMFGFNYDNVDYEEDFDLLATK